MRRPDFESREDLTKIDPDVSLIVGREAARQDEKLILIASESIAPRAVREVLGSVFTNVYAEGYPSLRTTQEEESKLVDAEEQLAWHRRYGDRRYYKGTEFADLVEALAQRRVAYLFANERVAASEIFANVQPLSGAAANNAVYEALLEPGDTMLGLALTHGGHLTHGSPYNRSGRHYHALSYSVDPQTGHLDYQQIRQLVIEHRPKLIVAGGSAYPWAIDWAMLRSIADEVPGTRLMADIAHPAGLVVAKLFPNPVGYAHVVTFTTHKTLCGPRAAVILTTDENLAHRIDRAVFPGEQGGPHVNNIAAMAVAFRIAAQPQFRALQRQIVANAKALAAACERLGLELVCGGTDTHMLLVDLKLIQTATGEPLEGDVASRILDLGGIVCNKNTIPGDISAGRATGLRFGTVWATQRGLVEADMERLAELIHRTVTSIRTFHYQGSYGALGRGKLPLAELRRLRQGVDELLGRVAKQPVAAAERMLEISGPRAKLFLQEALTAQVFELQIGEGRGAAALDESGKTLAEVAVTRLSDDELGRERYAVEAEPGEIDTLREWLVALSDGYVLFDQDDLFAKVEGPVVIAETKRDLRPEAGRVEAEVAIEKPFFVGQREWLAAEIAVAKLNTATSSVPVRAAKPVFQQALYDGPARKGFLYEEHVAANRGRGMAPFGGWLMPVWYSGIRDEHHAVRHTAAIFDVTHMGVLEVQGPEAARFLDLVTTNYVPSMVAGETQYSFILDPGGEVLDDCLIYCRAKDRFMVVVNAANAEKIESWLSAVNSRRYLIDPERPHVAVDATAEIRNLRDPRLGQEGRVDLAVQGPRSLDIIQSAIQDDELRRRVARLRKNEFVEGRIRGHLGGVPVLISRTGYTGEPIGFEIYVPPRDAPAVWRKLLEIGRSFGALPAGLGARDAARTEAGFPLYGHELAGLHQISPAGAGYGQFVKLHKPFFVGRKAFVEGEEQRHAEIVRFGVRQRSTRVLRQGDPVVDLGGECLGHVTSSVVVDGAQVGMAYVARDRLKPGDAVLIFPLSRIKSAEKPKAELSVGDLTLVPEQAEVLPRFAQSGF